MGSFSFRARGWRLSGGVENAFPPFFLISWAHLSKGGQRSRGPLSAVFVPFGFRSACWGVFVRGVSVRVMELEIPVPCRRDGCPVARTFDGLTQKLDVPK